MIKYFFLLIIILIFLISFYCYERFTLQKYIILIQNGVVIVKCFNQFGINLVNLLIIIMLV